MVHKAAWDGAFAVLEGHRRTFGEYVNLLISEDALPEPDSPLLTPLRNYARSVIELGPQSGYLLKFNK
jgi:hypothetical protein